MDKPTTTQSEIQLFVELCGYLLFASGESRLPMPRALAYAYAANRLKLIACDDVFVVEPFEVGTEKYPFDAPILRQQVQACDPSHSRLIPDGINFAYGQTLEIVATGLIDKSYFGSLSDCDQLLLDIVNFRYWGMNAQAMLALGRDRFSEIKAYESSCPIDAYTIMHEGLGYSHQTATSIAQDLAEKRRVERIFEAL